MKRTYFIYKLTSPNGKVYIGQTYNINRRFASYRNLCCKAQKKLYASINKYGWDNFKKEIIHDSTCDKEYIDSIEQKHIDKYFETGNSLNLAERVDSPSYKKGKFHVRSKPILQFDNDLNLVKEWVNGTIAAKELGLDQTSISKACRTGNAYLKGYYWRFKEKYDYEELCRIKERPHHLCYPVIQLSKKGEFIKEWESQTQASRELNINQANIWRVLCGKGMSAGGYKWVIKENYNKH